MATATYTVAQQVAAFTFSVNSAADLSFASLADMQKYVTTMSNVNLADTTIQGMIGSDWTPVWGPVVWINPAQTGSSLVADNTMACYYSPSQNLFIIAIAGTNPGSMFDWEKEDLAIRTMVEWNTISPGSGSNSGYISTGTSTGMNVLLTMKDGSQTTMLSGLQNYIQTNSITGSTIAIGGHSLGGALAPCLGLYFYDNLDTLKLTGQNISVYAYAGPSPGEQEFATYYDGRINSTSFSYSSQYNTIDIVPMASVLADLATIPDIYGNSIAFTDSPVNTFTGVLVTCVQLESLAAGFSGSGEPYTQVSTNLTSFTASFNSDVYNNCSSQVALLLSDMTSMGVSSTYMSELGNFVNFMYQAVAQHGPAYCGGTVSLPLPKVTNPKNIWTSEPVTGALSIDDFTVEYQKNLAANAPANATFNSSAARMIKKLTGVDLMNMPVSKKVNSKQLQEQ